ncbi:PTS glucitol/sorbitol transporter subunit IIB [Neobacillus sp. MM2021_6]|uniref:PTS glucitol/sorbitol transporter subunit IIB n=1 Tax=Bacillaceae TaxID=186817 RepID=UPI00140E3C1A|nr:MULTISPECIES: PTS glucitol/sorbitol transporter subunit IIB [Bacillaceae]MBO0958670.1 PTS glucitol/sorbitol transporter subunit IIB [Neobacillus sp. MM2021_6]NHC20190.1 PTS glucitol/sorbitol transporter subunit IIB [Bacillus sp. MM2020_4]
MENSPIQELVGPNDHLGVFVSKGPGGWGKGLELYPNGKKKKVVSLTGGGIHPVAQKIGDLIHCPVIDAYKEKVDPEEMVVVIVDCGGNARMGVYPMKRIPTINVKPLSPSGPLAKHITEDIFVSGVTVGDITPTEKQEAVNLKEKQPSYQLVKEKEIDVPVKEKQHPLSMIAKTIAIMMSWIYQSGKDVISSFASHVLPLMIGISVFIGLINYFGFSQGLSSLTKYSLGSFIGLLLCSIICSIPYVSRYIGAGATFGQVLVTILAYEIGEGRIEFIWILPALFATNVQVGCDFLPTGLMMANSEEKTVQAGIKAVLYSRLITSVFCVIIAYLAGKLMGF